MSIDHSSKFTNRESRFLMNTVPVNSTTADDQDFRSDTDSFDLQSSEMKTWAPQLDSLVGVTSPQISSSQGNLAELDSRSSISNATLVSSKAAASLGRFQFLNDLRTSVPLLIFDSIAVLISIVTAKYAGSLLTTEAVAPSGFQAPLFSIAVVCFVLAIHHVHGLYPAVGLGHSIEFRRILRTWLIVALASGLTLVASPQLDLTAFLSYLVFIGILAITLPTFRAATRSIFGRYSWWTQSVLVIGDGAKAEEVFKNIARSHHEGLRPIGIAYDPSSHWSGDTTGARVYLGPTSAIEQILLATRTTRVVISHSDAMQDLHFGHYCNIPHVSLRAPWSNHPTEKATLVERNGSAEIHCFQRGLSPSALFAKRCMDVTLILLCSPLLIPIFATIAFLIKASSPGPIFYGQPRLGKNGRNFRVWKFRSMVPNADAVLQKYLVAHPELQDEWERDHKLKNDPRITTIGRLLRKTSLDELPQLWNVFVGEMSLVGPRPIVKAEIPKYGDVYALYTLVSPGITGLWQISGRNNTTYEERLRFDRFYVQNWSLMFDIHILYKTIKTAVFQEGAY